MRHVLLAVMAFFFCALYAEEAKRAVPPEKKDGRPVAPEYDGEMPPPPPPAQPPPAPMPHHNRWGDGNDIFVIMNRLKKEKPEEFARLEALRKKDFRQFMREMGQYIPKNSDLRRFAELKKEERLLAKKILETKDAEEKAKLEKELKAKLKEDFDMMVKNAEERIVKMQQRLQVIKENEEQFLKDRYESMLWQSEHKKDGELPPPPPELNK